MLPASGRRLRGRMGGTRGEAGLELLPVGASGDWRKLKCSSGQELVVGGWTDPSGTRSGFGALLVGYHDGSGLLRYAGPSGPDSTPRSSDHPRRVAAARDGSSPFADAPSDRRVHWCRPMFVAEVRFTEWTPDGRLRHPAFVGLREDKDPAEVRREDSR